MDKFTIKQVSEMFNIPSSTLRYYEEVGILTNIERTNNKQRVYTQAHINRLKTICCFKGTGMSISMLQSFFSYEEKGFEHIDDILDLLNERKTIVEDQLEELSYALQHVKRKLNYYEDIKKAININEDIPTWDKYRNKSYK